MAKTSEDLCPPGARRVEVVPMRRRHVPAVLRIEAQVCPRPWTLGLFMGELSLEERCYFVARGDGAVVGYVGLMLGVSEGHVTTLAVDPAWRRQGVGTRLLLEVAVAARRRGVPSLTLEVRVSNRAAQALYRRFGFAPAGVRPGYYGDTREDALVMWVHDVGEEAYARRLMDIRTLACGGDGPRP